MIARRDPVSRKAYDLMREVLRVVQLPPATKPEGNVFAAGACRQDSSGQSTGLREIGVSSEVARHIRRYGIVARFAVCGSLR